MMARAEVLYAVDGRPGWYVVRDGTGNVYEVQAAVAGFGFRPGREYRLLVPDGEYRPSRFRLLPFSSPRRWVSAAELSGDSPATAAALYLYKDKFQEMRRQDASRKVKSVMPGRVAFEDGGCARVRAEDEGLYAPGDCVAVIHEEIRASGGCASSAYTGGKGVVVGFGCAQPPRALSAPDSGGSCSPLFEYWRGYLSPSADLVAGGGEFVFLKSSPEKWEVGGWTAAVDPNYAERGMPHGLPCTVWAGDILRVETLPLEVTAEGAELSSLAADYPAPVFMGVPGGAILSPHVEVYADVGRKLLCGEKRLMMTVNLATGDTHGYYSWPALPGYGPAVGLQLPACLILVFGSSPFPAHIGAENINADLYPRDGGGSPRFASIEECDLDGPFTLVYSSPGSASFASLRVPHPRAAAEGQYALLRPEPRRTPGGGWHPAGGLPARGNYNAPMDDVETRKGFHGGLHARCFDETGADITPGEVAQIPGTGGAFPGFFEIAERGDVTRDVYKDFLAAYPFMKGKALPSLSRAVFYAQGRINRWVEAGQGYTSPNPSWLECQRIEFFHTEGI